jgi:hypothetical protein
MLMRSDSGLQEPESQTVLMNAQQSQFTRVGRDQYNIGQVTNVNHYGDQHPVPFDLKPADRSAHYVHPCLPETRRWAIDEIHRLLDDDRMPNILWLSGSPGAGKSTIASTLESDLRKMGRLGSSFFCKRDDVALSDPAALWRTVAWDLAQRDAYFAEKLTSNLKHGLVDPARADIESHFKYMIAEPLTESLHKRTDGLEPNQSNHFHGRSSIRLPVVVLDALDECGSNDSQSAQRRVLMDTITKWSRLHPSLKLFITSRDQYITPAFRRVCHHITLNTGGLADGEVNADIQRFFESRFADIASQYHLRSSWPGKSVIRRLTNHAAGLFIWAETVIRFVEQGLPEKQLKFILKGEFRNEGDAIDQLYEQILRTSFKDNNVADTVKRVVGAIVLAKTPLYRGDLYRFLGKPEEDSSIKFILERLSSVISTNNPDGRIHISHLSFAEFICDPRRCRDFVIDHSKYSRIMGLSCLRIMKNGLRFNMCHLKTSHCRNDALDLTSSIKEHIPAYLLYACCFWAEHLSSAVADVKTLKEVKDFLEVRFLYWLEVLSLVKEVKVASRALTLIGGWSQVSFFSHITS